MMAPRDDTQATVGETLQAMKLPEYAGSGMTTHHLDAAARDNKNAEDALQPTDRAVFAARADQHLLFAHRSTESMIAQWREYNARADRLIAHLDDADEPDESHGAESMRPRVSIDDLMPAVEEAAAEITGCHPVVVPPGRTAAGQRYCEIPGGGWLTDVDMCPAQERVADILRRHNEELLAGLEWEQTDCDPVFGEPRWRRLVGPWAHCSTSSHRTQA